MVSYMKKVLAATAAGVLSCENASALRMFRNSNGEKENNPTKDLKNVAVAVQDRQALAETVTPEAGHGGLMDYFKDPKSWMTTGSVGAVLGAFIGGLIEYNLGMLGKVHGLTGLRKTKTFWGDAESLFQFFIDTLKPKGDEADPIQVITKAEQYKRVIFAAVTSDKCAPYKALFDKHEALRKQPGKEEEKEAAKQDVNSFLQEASILGDLFAAWVVEECDSRAWKEEGKPTKCDNPGLNAADWVKVTNKVKARLVSETKESFAGRVQSATTAVANGSLSPDRYTGMY